VGLEKDEKPKSSPSAHLSFKSEYTLVSSARTLEIDSQGLQRVQPYSVKQALSLRAGDAVRAVPRIISLILEGLTEANDYLARFAAVLPVQFAFSDRCADLLDLHQFGNLKEMAESTPQSKNYVTLSPVSMFNWRTSLNIRMVATWEC
jgi:hypothetical protein